MPIGRRMLGMENGGGHSGEKKRKKISTEDVLTKLKDDGDFDRLRLKIIRQLKDDGELRNSIISMVKQSSTLSRPGAENMKPRQLSDAIHQEIGDQVMGQISDGVWKIIRSGDGMKTEIRETIQVVYDKLLKSKVNEEAESSSRTDLLPEQQRHDTNGFVATSPSENEGRLSDGEPNEPPGFGLYNHQENNKINQDDPHKEKQRMSQRHDDRASAGTVKETCHTTDMPEPDSVHNSAPPGFHETVEHKQSEDGSDDDPDVPPGFG